MAAKPNRNGSGRPPVPKSKGRTRADVSLDGHQLEWLRSRFKGHKKDAPHADMSEVVRALVSFAMSMRVPARARTSESELLAWLHSLTRLGPREDILKSAIALRYGDSFHGTDSANADRALAAHAFGYLWRTGTSPDKVRGALKRYGLDSGLWQQISSTLLRTDEEHDVKAASRESFGTLARQLEKDQKVSASAALVLRQIREALFGAPRGETWAVVRWVYVNGLRERDLSTLVGVSASKLKWYLGYEDVRYPPEKVRAKVWAVLEKGWGLDDGDALRGADAARAREPR